MTTTEGIENEVPMCTQYYCGHIAEGRFWLGSEVAVSLSIDKIKEMIRSYKDNNMQLQLITIAHVHPAVQFQRESRVRADGKKLKILFPFNFKDLELIQELSQKRRNIKFRGMAVTPDGFNYSVTYLNGRPVE